jgi:hypothetical protein
MSGHGTERFRESNASKTAGRRLLPPIAFLCRQIEEVDCASVVRQQISPIQVRILFGSMCEFVDEAFYRE